MEDIEGIDGLEVFDVVSDPIVAFDYIEYKLKTYPSKITSQKALFLISVSGKAFVFYNGTLTNQTEFYQTLKIAEGNPSKKKTGKSLNQKKMTSLVEGLMRREEL